MASDFDGFESVGEAARSIAFGGLPLAEVVSMPIATTIGAPHPPSAKDVSREGASAVQRGANKSATAALAQFPVTIKFDVKRC